MADDVKAIVFQGCKKVQLLIFLFLAWFIALKVIVEWLK
jgi:hypothetical protein